MSAPEPQLDVTRPSIVRLLNNAFGQRNEAEREHRHTSVTYWDGYIRALQHVLDMEHE